MMAEKRNRGKCARCGQRRALATTSTGVLPVCPACVKELGAAFLEAKEQVRRARRAEHAAGRQYERFVTDPYRGLAE